MALKTLNLGNLELANIASALTAAGSIDPTFPVAGQDNNSQGFRDNFDYTQASLTTVTTVLTDLNNNTAKLNNDNNFNGVIIENAETALKQASKHTQCEILDYTAAPIFMEGREKGAHEWIIEFKTPPKDLSLFTKSLDSALMDLNSDYQAKRFNNITLNLPKVHVARQRLFYDWLKQKNKLGGQHKVPRLSNKRDFIEELLHLNT